MQVTDEELEAVARAIAASVLDCLCAKRWVNNAAREAFVAGVVTDYLPVARAAILAYLATPGQVQLREVLQLVYGALWCTVQFPPDVPRPPGTYPAHISLPVARDALIEVLTKTERALGITRARMAIGERIDAARAAEGKS